MRQGSLRSTSRVWAALHISGSRCCWRRVDCNHRYRYGGVVLRGAAVITLLVLCVTACGATSAAKAPTQAAKARKVCPNQQRALAKLDRDLAALRKAGRLPTKNHLIGNHAINLATDKFLLDV